jgi:hypothetical protein
MGLCRLVELPVNEGSGVTVHALLDDGIRFGHLCVRDTSPSIQLFPRLSTVRGIAHFRLVVVQAGSHSRFVVGLVAHHSHRALPSHADKDAAVRGTVGPARLTAPIPVAKSSLGSTARCSYLACSNPTFLRDGGHR